MPFELSRTVQYHPNGNYGHSQADGLTQAILYVDKRRTLQHRGNRDHRTAVKDSNRLEGGEATLPLHELSLS